MDIEKLIKSEAPSDSEHDKAYAEELQKAHDRYKNYQLPALIEFQKSARQRYSSSLPTHEAVASCMVLYQLIAEKQGTKGLSL